MSVSGILYWNEAFRYPILGEENDSKIFYVTAQMWEYYPKEIKVQEGDKVIIYLTSLDVPHGLFLEAWNITVNSFLNQTETIEFTADKVGRFEYFCTHYCGIGHKDMRAYIVVEEKD